MRIPALVVSLVSGLLVSACLGGDEQSPTDPGPTTGDLQVAASTSGEDLDRDGYTVTVAGPGTISFGVNDARTFTDLEAGDRTVELSGLRSNCSVLGGNPKTVTVPAGGSASVTFTVECRPRIGVLEVSASTTGEDRDGDGYTVTVDGSATKTVDPNGSVRFADLREGSHRVELSGVRANCSVDRDSAWNASVAFDTMKSTAFSVDCERRTGDLRVSASTSGEDQDKDGYTVTVDGSRSRAVDPNGAVTFTDLDEGKHQVEFADMRGNCVVEGSNPRSAGVAFDSTVTASFSVNCASRTGELEVTASTSGEDPDSDGYTVTVNGSRSESIGPDGSATFTDLSEGDHEIELSGVRENCVVEGENPRTADVSFDSTTRTSFSVECEARTGALEVTVSTSGEDRDTDGYTVTVDGSRSRQVGPDGSATFEDLGEGEHEVELAGVKSNCGVEGNNPRTVAVDFNSTERAAFTVTCEASGALEVTVSTSGKDPDTNGYTVTVDGTRSDSVEPEGSVTFSELAGGEHEVELADVRDNCAVEGSNPRTVRIPVGGTSSTAFSVACEARTGELDVSASTSGEDQDTDGYVVTVDDSRSDSIDSNGTTTFTELGEEPHDVELTGVQGNCAVEGKNPRTVRIAFDSTSNTTFSVDCRAVNGQVSVSVRTSGDTTDTDGYTVTLDGDDSRSKAVGPNGSVNFTELIGGEHTVELSGVQVNCGALDGDRRTVSVTGEEPVAVSYTVDCEPALFNRIVYVSAGPNNLDLVVAGTNGSDRSPVGTGAGNALAPQVSPDGASIAFVSTRDGGAEIYALRLDGSEPVRLTSNSTRDWNPSWSPDGSRIAFERNDSFRNTNIYTVDREGGDLRQVTTNRTDDGDPFWGPDGYIYFVSDRDGNKEIYRIRPDGTGVERITRNEVRDQAPAVAPDGSRIVFVRAGGKFGSDREIFTMDPDGEEVRRLTENGTADWYPHFSPDGEWIVFSRTIVGTDEDVFRMDVDGRNVINLTNRNGEDFTGVFTPFR